MDYDFTYTGAEIQAILDTGKKLKDSGYIFLGVATPSTNPGTPTQKVYYEAKQAGTYTNFGGVVLPDGISLLIWNGSWTSETMICGDGGVFDISVYKSSGGTLATFADLSAALNGGNNIPVGVRKGGMSVKFVQSSDNKYVQYFLTKDEWSASEADWEKMNLEEEVSQFIANGEPYGILQHGGINATTGAEMDSATNRCRTIYLKAPFTIAINSGFKFLHLIKYNQGKSYQGYQELSGTSQTISDTTYLYRITFAKNDTSQVIDDLTIVMSSFKGCQYSTLETDVKNYANGLNTATDNYFKNTKSILNVDYIAPLESGYYTLDTVIAAIPNIYKKKGMIISFKTDAYSPVMYQLWGIDAGAPGQWKRIPNIYDLGMSSFCAPEWEQGSYSGLTDYGGGTRIRTQLLRYDLLEKLSVASGYKYYVTFFDKTKALISETTIQDGDFIFEDNYRSNYYFVRLRLVKSDNGDIAPSDGSNLVVYYKELRSIVAGLKKYTDDKFELDGRYNVFDKSKVIVGKSFSNNSTTWEVVDEPNAQSIIIPLYNWGAGSSSSWDDVYLRVRGIGARRTNQDYRIIFFQTDDNGELVPVKNGGAYGVNTDGEANIKLASLNFGVRMNYTHVGITLIHGNDFGNQNSSYGYVWSNKEISQGYPNWYDNVVINFCKGSNVIPYKEKNVVDMIPAYKERQFNKFGSLFSNTFIGHSDRGVANINHRFNFVMASDSHMNFNDASFDNIGDMVEFLNTYLIRDNIDCAIHDGDILNVDKDLYTAEQVREQFELYYKEVHKSCVDYIQVIGNHDRAMEPNIAIAKPLTKAETIELLNTYTKHTDTSNIYQYYDYADKKVRVICLDTYEFPLEDNGSGKVFYSTTSTYISQTQLEWFIGALSSTPADYSVILCVHSPAQDTNIQLLTGVLKAFKEKTSGSVTLSYTDESTLFPVSSVTAEYDFTNSDTRFVVGIFCGHVHMDEYYFVNGIHLMTIASQAVDNNVIYASRFKYSDNQNCMNMVSVDTTSHKMYIQRYGFGSEKNCDMLSQNEVMGNNGYLDKELSY